MRTITRRKKSIVIIALGTALVVASAFNAIDLPNVSKAAPTSTFVNFESAHVHPLDMTPDGTKLLAVNTANNSLEVFSVTATGLLNTASIPVGLDPVTVRARTNTEAWVVAQVSDEISIVDLSTNRVIRSLETKDEPADVVFAGAAVPTKAFVSCAGRESVQVFNLANLSDPPTEVLLKGEQPRALAVSNDKLTVYCAFFESGNATTVLNGNNFFNFVHGTKTGICSVQGGCTVIPNDVTNPGGPYSGNVNAAAGIIANAPLNTFNPPLNPANPPTPESKSLIVRKNAAGQWMDDNGGNWTGMVSGSVAGKARMTGWDMPDRDVAAIDAVTPATGTVQYQTRLGNILMSMAVNPATGMVNVIGTDATNEIRFEPVLNGKFLRVNTSQFSSLGGANTITDMNPHLNYTTSSVAPALRKQSVGDPRGIAITSDGLKMYVTGMGSNNVVVLNSNGTRNLVDPIPVGEGPTGIVLNGGGTRAFVLNKFEGSISTVDLSSNKEVARTNFFDPTPMVIKAGRKHLYDTHLGSGTGHISCGSCHVDGRWDGLGWDLGNPAGAMDTVDGKILHPLKGVKTTQFLIDIISKPGDTRGRGNLHWRGDKDEFADFDGAFQHLQGLSAPKPANEMQEFADFLAECWYVPNPFRVLKPESDVSNSRMNAVGVRGTGTSFQTVPNAVNLFIAVNVNCAHCHNAQTGRGELPGNGNVAGQGPGTTVDFGPNRNMASDLRSSYRKNGFFYNTTEATRGFGLMSEGVMETWFNGPGVANYLGDYETELLSWSGGVHSGNCSACFGFPLASAAVNDALPGVGFRTTLNGPSIGNTTLLASMLNLADTRPAEYGMIVKGTYGGKQRGFYYLGSSNYQSDSAGQVVAHSALLASAQGSGGPLSWTLVQPTTKVRMGVDADGDGIYDLNDKPTEFALRMMLEGALTGTTMRHDLDDQGLIPTTDPYGTGAIMATPVTWYTGDMAIVDWVRVELRSSSNNTTVVTSTSALLQANGTVIMPTGEQTLRFESAPAGSYYVAVKHRNHLGAMTLNAVDLKPMGTLVDFTLPGTATYGTEARKNVSGVMALWAGDVISDGVMKYTGGSPANDRDPILVKIGGVVPTNSVPGYWPEDVNLDGVVKYTGPANDRDMILVNIGGVVPTNTRLQQLP